MIHNLLDLDTQMLTYLPSNIDIFCLHDFTQLTLHGHLILTLCAAAKI